MTLITAAPDWPIKPLSAVIVEMRGGAPLKPNDFTKDGVKVLPKGAVGQTGWLDVVEKDLQYCSHDYANAHRTNQVDEQYTIVVLRDLVPSGPSIGLIVRIGDAERWLLAQGVYGFKLNEELDPAYLSQLSNTHWYRKLMNQIMVGSTQVHITNTAFKAASIPMPPRAEQSAIATALSDVDALIAGLERLIAKKRDIKQAAMQQLLTSQTRLPGFSGAWAAVRLGDFVQFLKNGVNSRAELTQDGDVKYLHYGDIHGASGVFLDAAQTAMPCLPRVKAAALDRLRDGDLVFADASEDVDGIGKAVELRVAAGSEVVSGLHTIAARFDKNILADGFKAYLQFLPSFSRHLKRLAAGTKVFATNRGHVASAELMLPGVEEQTAIATVLSDMDADLVALEARLAKTRAIKQGMMQELLTGRTRLV